MIIQQELLYNTTRDDKTKISRAELWNYQSTIFPIFFFFLLNDFSRKFLEQDTKLSAVIISKRTHERYILPTTEMEYSQKLFAI